MNLGKKDLDPNLYWTSIKKSCSPNDDIHNVQNTELGIIPLKLWGHPRKYNG